MTHQHLKDFAQSKKFCHIINYAILSFAFIVGLETILKDPEWQFIFRIVDYLYLGLFTVEIIIRIFAEDHPGLYFVLFTRKKVTKDGVTRIKIEFSEHGFWNYFDFALIFLSIVGLFAQVLLHPSFIQIGRMFRIFRIIRLLEISEHLKEIETRIMSIVPTVFSFAVLLLILNYIYAILGMFMFEGKYFSSIVDSFITLFQVMTLDNWSDVMGEIKTRTPDYNPFIIEMYFVSFVVFTSIIAFNVFIAVMTSQVADKMERDLEHKVEASKDLDESIHVQLREDMKEIVAELQLLRATVAELKGKS